MARTLRCQDTLQLAKIFTLEIQKLRIGALLISYEKKEHRLDVWPSTRTLTFGMSVGDIVGNGWILDFDFLADFDFFDVFVFPALGFPALVFLEFLLPFSPPFSTVSGDVGECVSLSDFVDLPSPLSVAVESSSGDSSVSDFCNFFAL